MPKDLVVVAARFLQGVGKYRQAVECPFIVDVDGQVHVLHSTSVMIPLCSLDKHRSCCHAPQVLAVCDLAKMKAMRQILPHPLWLGHAGDGRDFRLIVDAGIQAVVQLAAEEPVLQLPRELTYCRFPLVDGPDNESKRLSLAVTTVANLLEENVPTLVCCGAGMSRSPAIGPTNRTHSVHISMSVAPTR